MQVPLVYLSRTTGLKPLKNQTSEEFLKILARGAIRYCLLNRIQIPKTYEDYTRDIVVAAHKEMKNGSFLIQDLKEINAICKLFGVSLIDEHIPKLLLLSTVKSTQTTPNQKRQALEGFGEKFNELAEAFGSGICHNQLVFKKMQELISHGEIGVIMEEEKISPVI